jgi:chromosome partitioning protein
VAGITESCSVCAGEFEIQFRYQMEERDGGFSFYCTQKCLEASQLAGSSDKGTATCDACAKRFTPDLVSQVLYVTGRRHYACSLACRAQVLSEAKGARLGDMTPSSPPPAPAPAPPPEMAIPPVLQVPAPLPGRVSSVPPGPSAKQSAAKTAGAVAVPVMPAAKREKAATPKPSEGVPRYLAVFNHKGGTGKTTTAVSIAGGLAAKGKKVLLVDTDAQGNVGVSLGAASERSLYHVLVMGLRVADAVKQVRPNLDLLPSNETLAAAELYLAGRQNRDRVLQDRLASAAAAYDFVVLDCSPSLSLMNQNALVFADSVLVPVACDFLSLVGVRQVIKTVKNVNALLHHPVQIWGVLPTFYDARAKICREAVSTLKQHFGERCLPPIRAAIKVKEAPAQGQTIFEYAEDSNAAEDYATVVQMILASRQQTAGAHEASATPSKPSSQDGGSAPKPPAPVAAATA